ncbi:MAG: histidinol phosphate phosphatase domain-containing protein [Candidatus Omnitrophica bacterium]|nr:histidinol phosphate phosphatase domain-containing protein [Candidatus Omnitrophota bacterium]
MYDLHTHSLLSDGVLLPSELARRYEEKGYKAIAITDHCDYSNVDFVISAITNFCGHWPKKGHIKVLPGIELTHLPVEQYKPLAAYARSKGIKVIVAHGESIAEPVARGTNRAAIEAGVNILAHPGLVTDKEARMAKQKGVLLEITARKGHNQTNQIVLEQALENGARLIINTDSHMPEDILDIKEFKNVGLKSGLTSKQYKAVMKNTAEFIKEVL